MLHCSKQEVSTTANTRTYASYRHAGFCRHDRDSTAFSQAPSSPRNTIFLSVASCRLSSLQQENCASGGTECPRKRHLNNELISLTKLPGTSANIQLHWHKKKWRSVPQISAREGGQQVPWKAEPKSQTVSQLPLLLGRRDESFKVKMTGYITPA